MEVKIGVQHSPRELTLESPLTPAEVEEAVNDAMSAGSGVLSLKDDKGRRVIVPADRISYVEIADVDLRRVGFTAGS